MNILGKCEPCHKHNHVRRYHTVFTTGTEWLCPACVRLGGVIAEEPVAVEGVRPDVIYEPPPQWRSVLLKEAP